MPATESTWRRLSLLHILFGVSSVAMLGVTVWMFVADHNREWKKYQRTSMNLEQFVAEQRINEQNSADYKSESGKLKGEVAVAQYRGWYADAAATKPLFELLNQAAEKNVAKFSFSDVQKDLQAKIEAVDLARAALTAEFKNKTDADDELRRAIAVGESNAIVQKFDQYLAARTKFLLALDGLAGKLKFAEDNLSLEVKAQTAAQGKAAGDRDMAINGGAPAETIAKFEKQYAEETLKLDGGFPVAVDPAKSPETKPVIGLRQKLQQVKMAREALANQVLQITDAEIAAKKNYNDHENQLTQLNKAMYERANNAWKTALSFPIIDAFGGPLKPLQIWLPELPQKNGSFPDVARFDRCVTCHTGISATAPGSATEPAYPSAHTFEVTLDLGKIDAAVRKSVAEARLEATDLETTNGLLAKTYGFSLAEKGLFQINDPTISVVYPQSLAAEAGLSMGDVITAIGTTDVTTRTAAETLLLDTPPWTRKSEGEPQPIPVRITVRRGVPQPYCSHPRMDLFISDSSPHPVGKFGCTICHQGSGSATQFKWTSHTPNNKVQENDWIAQYGWFNNHHWTTPMLPNRFEQSACLKCHHEVVELEASARFPDPPADKLVHGYETIREYGCFGCHEINGFDGPKRRIGPDMRSEPAFYAAAEQLLADPGLKDLAPNAVKLAETVARHPEDDAARRALQTLVAADAELAAKKSDAEKPKLASDSIRLAAVLKDVESPGQMRKVGPSLRHIAQKVGYEFLYDWIRNPRDFRPTTKMPRFFGVTDHLSGAQLEKTNRYESLEIRGMTEFLLANSQKYEQIKPATDVEAASIERGKKVFEIRGCLACHAHDEFPQGHAHQGPNLSRIAEKLSLGDAARGKAWLYSWVREPNLYHSRTVMPNLYLDSYPKYKMQDGREVRGADGKPEVESMIDPSADVVAYLMQPTGKDPWKPENVPARDDLPKISDVKRLDEFRNEGYDVKLLTDLEALAFEHLQSRFNNKLRASQALESGIPAESARGDDTALVGMTPKNRAEKLVQYIGRRSISKYGCFGCHDIPGYEDAKPIGAALADWGRKDPAKLAFENIGQYVHNVMESHGFTPPTGKQEIAHAQHDDHSATEVPAAKPNDPVSATFATETTPKSELEIADAYFTEKLVAGEREGFLWNKIHRPRSYDYKKTETKSYNDRYRMPQFRFAQSEAGQDAAVEAVMTFVLGLVSEPPPPSYVYMPEPRQKAILAGIKLIEKYNCGGCHQLEMERWDITFKPGTEDLVVPAPDHEFFPFHKIVPSTEQVATSKKTDKAGRERATLIGLAKRDPTTGKIAVFDEDGEPIEDVAAEPAGTKFRYQFNLYVPTVIDGQMVPVTARPVLLTDNLFSKRLPGDERAKIWAGRGGDLTRLLFPVVLKDVAQPPANKDEALGWLPPTLHGEGKKVQTKWLHDFLLEPYSIRPAAVLRMPKFGMSPAEAQTFAEYFAAMDNAVSPYEYDERGEAYLTQLEKQEPDLLPDALKIITSNAACVKCHLIGDYSPGGDPKALGPQLARVHERLRPEYVKGWVANPQYYLPYSAMLKVIQYDKPSDAVKAPGATPGEQAVYQLNAVIDYLMNYDTITQQGFKFSKLVPPPPAAAPTAAGTPSAPPAAGSPDDN